MENYDALKLENQLCFPLYAAAKEVVRKYKAPLDDIGLTYTQYIVMMVLWEERSLGVKQIGRRLYLDSGTLTPLLKKLETAGLIERKRDPKDERNVKITVTNKGMALREQASAIPLTVGKCLDMTQEEMTSLYQLLYKILEQTERAKDYECI